MPPAPHPTKWGSQCFCSKVMGVKTGVEDAVSRQIIFLTFQQIVEQLNLLCIEEEMLSAGKDVKRKKKNTQKPLSATVCYYFQSFAVDFKPLGMVSTHLAPNAVLHPWRGCSQRDTIGCIQIITLLC